LVHFGLKMLLLRVILSIYSQRFTNKFDKFISNKTPKEFHTKGFSWSHGPTYKYAYATGTKCFCQSKSLPFANQDEMQLTTVLYFRNLRAVIVLTADSARVFRLQRQQFMRPVGRRRSADSALL